MKIKEVCALTGLTERTVRFYVEKNLLSPHATEQNGKTFRDYSAGDVNTLRTIATLRKMLFSIEEIDRMLHHPKEIPAVLTEYRARMEAETEVRADILAMDNERLAQCTSAAELARRMQDLTARRSLPETDVFPDFGRLDDDGPHNADEAARRFWRNEDRRCRRGFVILLVVAAVNVTLSVLKLIFGASGWIALLLNGIFSGALIAGRNGARILFLIGLGLGALGNVMTLTQLPVMQLSGSTAAGLAVLTVLFIAYDITAFVLLLKSRAVLTYIYEKENA